MYTNLNMHAFKVLGICNCSACLIKATLQWLWYSKLSELAVELNIYSEKQLKDIKILPSL